MGAELICKGPNSKSGLLHSTHFRRNSLKSRERGGAFVTWNASFRIGIVVGIVFWFGIAFSSACFFLSDPLFLKFWFT